MIRVAISLTFLFGRDKKIEWYNSIIKMSSKANYKVYMDIQIGASAAGRIIF